MSHTSKEIDKELSALYTAKGDAVKAHMSVIGPIDQEIVKLQEKLVSIRHSDILAGLPMLLKLKGKHAHNSCSDESPVNYDRGCGRCCLINIRDLEDSIGEYTLEIVVRQKKGI